MKYIMQLAIILAITAVGELLYILLPLPIPASIYGLCLLFLLLATGILKVSQIQDSARFLIDIMPVMFIPPAVGLLDSYSLVAPVLLPVCLIVVSTTFVVMWFTGKVTQYFVEKGEKK